MIYDQFMNDDIMRLKQREQKKLNNPYTIYLSSLEKLFFKLIIRVIIISITTVPTMMIIIYYFLASTIKVNHLYIIYIMYRRT